MPSERTGSLPSIDACRECGRSLPPDANFCPGCGAELRPGSDAAYCTDCGERLAPEDEFCAECGAAQPGAGGRVTCRPDDEGDSEVRRAFRARVRDHLDDGWELTEDRGDRVVLVDRDVGSIPVHVLLLLTTGGVGNLLYGWYHYTEMAETRRLGVSDGPIPDGELPEPGGNDDPLVALSGYLLGGILLLIGFGIAAVSARQGALPGAVFGAAFALVGLALTPPAERRLGRRHGLSRFGRIRTVDHRVIRSTERTESPCVVCGESFERGVVRRRRAETVAAGVPIRTHATERNRYCADCAQTELFGESDESDLAAAGSDLDAAGPDFDAAEPDLDAPHTRTEDRQSATELSEPTDRTR
mgnify:CR=1 FL=1